MAGAVVSRVKVSDVLAELPAASVSLATMVWDPLAEAGGREGPGARCVGSGGAGDGVAVDREVNDSVGVAGAGQGGVWT